MVRLGISVEGPTEERFIKAVLAPYLLRKDIVITPISLGGNINIDKAKSELKRIANSFDFVTTLYDFYGFRKKAANEDKASLERKLANSVHEQVRLKLIPYVQMYEFEGLLFSCPDSMDSVLNENGVKAWAQSVLGEFDGNPELINDSVEAAPSIRLGSKTSYRKTIHGPNIAEKTGIDKIREMCNGFDAWLTRIEDISA